GGRGRQFLRVAADGGAEQVARPPAASGRRRPLDPTIPPPVSQLTMRLLAKRAAERPPTAGAVVKWLRAIEGNLNPTSSPYPVAIPVIPPPPLPAGEATLALPPSAPARGGAEVAVRAGGLAAGGGGRVRHLGGAPGVPEAGRVGPACPGGRAEGRRLPGERSAGRLGHPAEGPELPGGAPLSKDALVSQPTKI